MNAGGGFDGPSFEVSDRYHLQVLVAGPMRQEVTLLIGLADARNVTPQRIHLLPGLLPAPALGHVRQRSLLLNERWRKYESETPMSFAVSPLENRLSAFLDLSRFAMLSRSRLVYCEHHIWAACHRRRIMTKGFRGDERKMPLKHRLACVELEPAYTSRLAPTATFSMLALTQPGSRIGVMNNYNGMNIVFRFGLCALAAAAFSLNTWTSNADTLGPANAFTKHGLPVPGAYFKNKESKPQAAVVVAKSGKSAANPKPTTPNAPKKQSSHFRYATS